MKTHLKLSRLQIETERQNRQLHENYDHLKKIEDLHNKLTQTLVHDMREPLIAIAGYLETLETDAEKKLNSNELETLRNARTSGLVLLGMINSLLDVSVVLNRNRSSET